MLSFEVSTLNVHVLRAQRHRLREISRLLHLARNMARQILHSPPH